MTLIEIQKTLEMVASGAVVSPDLAPAQTRHRELQQQVRTLEADLTAAQQTLRSAEERMEQLLVTGQKADHTVVERAQDACRRLEDRLRLVRRAQGTVTADVARLSKDQAAHVRRALLPLFQDLVQQIDALTLQILECQAVLAQAHAAAINHIGPLDPLSQGFAGALSLRCVAPWRDRVLAAGLLPRRDEQAA